ncbi:lipoyl synthase [Desulfatirhabdium butyrativorans]|uniref:lipoyl synthase n=1 Tax=Desulfatirhabdium butyrativorans TaxID=340467 RepID=UPI0004234542|nr:lipoyl synthase [Desulfatirhabdium butyrativorans]
MTRITPKPEWLRRRLPTGNTYESVRRMLRDQKLHTVCENACCPNQWECYSDQTATFLIMGPVCTRNCRFCAVHNGLPVPVDPEEPGHVAKAAHKLGLRHVVITSVTRDDLPDGGASWFVETIHAVREALPDAGIEVLIPDFQGNGEALNAVLEARPTVLNHNIETVERLYPLVRPMADYRRSLDLLEKAAGHPQGVLVKSGIMVGLGERDAELFDAIADLRSHGCTLLTIGQYLQPSKAHLPVERYVRPAHFDMYREKALKMGFSRVVSGPFVRSSYHAGILLNKGNQL